jgi:hypothetical protein
MEKRQDVRTSVEDVPLLVVLVRHIPLSIDQRLTLQPRSCSVHNSQNCHSFSPSLSDASPLPIELVEKLWIH